MRTLFTYLPVTGKGFFCLSQQRFAKFRGDPDLIYPVIPATGITLLAKNNFQSFYLDSLLEALSLEQFLTKLKEIKPDLLIFETKTPVVKQNWETVKEIKKALPEIIIAAVGDHVSVLPEETLESCPVDYIITGGDYDWGMLQLAKHLRDNTPLPKGIYYRSNGEILNTGKYELIKDLDSLPYIDRNLVPWQNYHEAWRLSNKFFYIMASRGCPYHCSFCSWPQMLYGGKVRNRSVENVITEIEMLISTFQAEEIFFDDDTFTYNREWVLKFCDEIQKRKIKIIWSCNGRVDNVDFNMLSEMKKSGCRMIKFGIESASPITLKKLNKGYTIDEVKKSFCEARKAGILRHGTVMIGYPWETKQDITNTMIFLKAIDVDTVQFSMPIVYPGTKLFEEAKENNWLCFPPGEWEKYDMSRPTLINPEISGKEIIAFCSSAWKKIYFQPKFIINKILRIRNLNDIRWLFRGTKAVIRGHLSGLKGEKY